MSSQADTLPLSDDLRRRAQQQSLARSGPPLDIPGYVPEKFMGAGAYGEVWTAIEESTRRRVAIKFYSHRGGLDWSFLSREVEKLAFLAADRYVVQLIDVGWDAEPPYYIMEYVEHGSLDDRLRQGPLPIDEAVGLFRDLAIGLCHAHNKGILHCDLKPANVLLDQDYKPRLADFGQSRLSHEQSPALGTLFFMAPEQANLHAAPDARWDVYALGALFYCLLVGEPPYRTDEAATQIAAAGNLEAQLAAYALHLTSSPKPRLQDQVPGIDRELAEIVDRCLAIDPHRRFHNPQEVVDALDARALRRARRPLVVLGALGPALLLLIVALFLWRETAVAVEESEQTAVERGMEGDRFAARVAADNVARQINRRWFALERAAARPELVEQVLAAADQPMDSAPRERLQATIETLHAEAPDLEIRDWFLLDEHGHVLARSPWDPRIEGKSFAFRDYFHGLGHDLPPRQQNMQPIVHPHRSHVFISQVTGTHTLAFSVPVWHADPSGERRVIGVMALEVDVGKFVELRSESLAEKNLVAVLIDLRSDDSSPPRRGQILEHPYLTRQRQAGVTPLPRYIETELVDRAEQLTRLVQVATSDEELATEARLSSLDDYHDPLDGDYAGRWLAAIEPVIVPGRPSPTCNSELIVLVQERYESVVIAAHQLARTMTVTALWAMGAQLLAVSMLWGFVMLVLNQSPSTRLNRWLARWWRRRPWHRHHPGSGTKGTLVSGP